MPVTVRVQNFQSIKDATVVIDGFTVVTGPNNSGKTALMRAVRGVFTNASPGTNIHHGAAHITVTIDFGDGNVVVWEKGWEKPGGKGKTVNRYTVNGHLLPNVGRGCPPEVLALGMNPIQAGTQTVWPQIADQFKGVLFLVGSPGSVMAEAIANVDRVGKLSEALKLSEKERRQITSKLNVRREDEKGLEEEAATYDGLDAVGDDVGAVEALAAEAQTTLDEFITLSALRNRHQSATGTVKDLEGVEKVDVPDTGDVVTLQGDLATHTRLRDDLAHRGAEVEALEGIEAVIIPDIDAAKNLRDELADLIALRDRLAAANAALEADVSDIELPATDRVLKIKAAVVHFKSLASRRDAANAEIEKLEGEAKTGDTALATAEQQVASLLAELGRCPTCGSDTDHNHGEAA
jgi:DNA repair exonuclease SbcCD ATPase subunit